MANFNKDINLEKKLYIRDLFKLLKIKSDDFLEKNVKKNIYMIKIVELIDSFLDNFKKLNI